MKVLRLIWCLFMLLIIGLAVSPAAVFAQEEPTPTPIPQSLDMTAKYPKIEITSGETAQFEVQLMFNGEYGGKSRVFDLVATAPKDWTVEVTPSYPADKKIASIELSPGSTVGETVNVKATPAYWLQPEPGEYPVTFVATSGDLKSSIELKAVITAKYNLYLVPANQRYNTTATAGNDNFFSFDIMNSGSAAVNNITFSSDKPEDWTIRFTPEKVDNLVAGNSQTVDVNIKPPSKAIAGDYLITIKVSGKQTTAQDMQVRVTVETPTVWGWVGVIIVVGVIVGLVFTFRAFSRR